MSAPNSEFIQKRLETLVGTTTKDARIGIYDANVATLKTRYYLDFVRGVSEYDANGVEIVDKSGFIGGCVIGSDNYYMHNTARHWSVGSLTASNEVLFNDAGKNTLGTAKEVTGASRVMLANYFSFEGDFKAAFHVPSTIAGDSSIGWQVRKQGDTGWMTFPNGGSLSAGEELIKRDILIHQIPVFEQGDRIEFRPFNKNAEGEYYGSIGSFNAGRVVTIERVQFSGATQSCTIGDWVTVILTTTANILYGGVDESGNLFFAPQGWYNGYFGTNTKEELLVGANGVIVSRYNCPEDPPPPTLYNATLTMTRGIPMPVSGLIPFMLSITRGTRGNPPSGDYTVTGFYTRNAGAGTGVTTHPFSITLPSGVRDVTQVLFESRVSYTLEFQSATATPTGLVLNYIGTDT